MFTFGIFTTHFPYVIMVAFYAYFLLFGVSQAKEGEVKLSEKSLLVQMHIDNSLETFDAGSYCFYAAFENSGKFSVFEDNMVKQKWRHLLIPKVNSSNHAIFARFNRPPPQTV